MYSSYLDILAGVLLVVLIWAAVRRWVVRPRRLSYDLTRNSDAIVIVGMIAGLMASTILIHSFYVAEGGTGPEADVIIGGALGRLFIDAGISESAASVLQGLFWWVHFAIILFFTVYIPFSKHMHMVAAPINAFFRTLDSRGALPAMDLGKRRALRGLPGAGLHLEATAGWICLRRVRSLLRCLPGQHNGQAALADAHRREPERPHD